MKTNDYKNNKKGTAGNKGSLKRKMKILVNATRIEGHTQCTKLPLL